MPAPASLAHLQILLSGGAANADPNASLGGIISSTRVLSQSATAPGSITGVVIDDAAGNAVGSGTLSYTYSATTPTLTWTPPGGSAGTAVDVSIAGKYAVQGASNGGILFVDVTPGSLPGSNQTNSITIANQVNKTFDDVSKAESLAGDVEYRAFYIKNTHTTETFVDVRLWRAKDTDGQDVIAVELDPVGKGNGSTTGVAEIIADEGTAPATVTWSSNAISETSSLVIGDLAPGECRAFWERRTVPANTTVATSANHSRLGLRAYV